MTHGQALPHAHTEGVWRTFRGRALHLGSMNRRLRLITALAAAQVLAAAVLLALRGLHVSTTPLVGGTEGLTSVPVAVLWLSVAFLALAWAYLLTAASQSHPAFATVGLAAFGVSLIPLSADVGWHGAAAWVRAAALAAILVLTGWSAARTGANGRKSETADMRRLLLYLCLTAGVYATFAWDASRSTVFRQFTFGVADQLMSTSYFLLPVLFLTGAEFSEWAEVIGDRVAAVADRLGRRVLLTALLVGISVVVLAHDVSLVGSQLWSQLVLFVLAALLVTWLGRRARPRGGWPRALPWAALALTSCAFIGILLVEVYQSVSIPQEHLSAADQTVGGPLHTYEHSRSPAFQVRVPENWEVLTLARGGGTSTLLTGFSGRSTRDPANFFVSEVPNRLLSRGTPLLPIFLTHFYGGEKVRLVGVKESKGWRETTFFLGSKLEAQAWERRIGGERWLLFGYANRQVFELNRSLFGFIWSSFKASETRNQPAATAERADPYRYDPVVTVPFLAWLGITALVGAVLLALRRRIQPVLQMGLLFVLAFGLLYVLSRLRQVLEQVVDGPLGPLYSLRLPGVQAAVAGLTLIFVAVAWLRSRHGPSTSTLRTLLMLAAGLQVLLWISQLYESASSVGARFSIAQGVVILLALLWELAVSGQAITNGHSTILPRASRVLAFCGYIMLVATAVVFFSSLRIQATGVAIEPQFESEGWPALGILQLAVPALLCLAALHLGLFENKPDARTSPDQLTPDPAAA